MRRRVLPAAALLAVLPLSVDVFVGTVAAAQHARPTTANLTTTYTVQSGDFLIGIATKLGVRLDDLLRLNGLTPTSVVHPGRVLVVPMRLATYTVRANDTMSGIASRHGMTMADLLAANSLRPTSVIFPGMVLKVAVRASTTPAPTTTVRPAAPTTSTPKVVPSAKARTYTVQSGDFLIGIANRLGVRLVDLLALNGLTLTSAVHPGSVLQVPSGATTPTTTPTTTTPSTPTTTTGTPPSSGATYTVVSGDFLLGIARKLNVRFSDLLALNQLGADSVVHPGTTLAVPTTKLPPPAPTTTTPSTPTTTVPTGAVAYTVRSGDSVLGISYRFGLKYGSILKLNGITLETPLVPGATLLLPPGTVIPPTPTTTTAPPTTDAPTTTVPTPSNDPIDQVVAFARAQVGKPYAFFTAGPDTYDCSGLTLAAYRQIGVRLPHQSVAQSKLGTSIDWTTEPIRPGDLVFTESTRAPGVIGHVGIAISATRWVHAPRSNDVVREGPIPPSSKIVVVRRFVND